MNDEFQMTNDERNPKAEVPTGLRTTLPSSFVIPQRGFTLLELLLAVLVFAIVLAAIHTVFFSAFKLRQRTTDAI